MHQIMRSSTASLTAFLLVLTVTADGCKGKSAPETPATTATQPAGASAPQDQSAAAAMSVDDLVAPIALYPDQLLGQLLLTAVNSQEVLDLGNWLIENQSIKTDAAPAAAKAAGFSTSAQYLAAFPQVVDNMCQNLDWTKQLGEAFKADQKGVMDAIQRKRMQAKQQGNLQSSPQMTVDTKTDSGKEVVEIKPANPEVVYVPQYNTTTVYTQPAPTQTTVVEEKSGVSTGAAVGMSLLSFGVGMAVGAAISNNNNYYPYPGWGGGGMYYGGHPYYPPPYRAPVYGGYHPAYGYHPPANYHWNNYNRNVNVNVNNNNYYNKYNSNNRVNTNNRGAAGNNAYLGANNNRPGANNQPGNRGGSSGYLGAKPQAGNQKPGASMADANPRGANAGGRNEAANRDMSRPNNAGGTAGVRPGGADAANRTGASPGGADRGFGNNNAGRTENHAAAQNRPATQNQQVAQNRGDSGGAFGGGSSGHAERDASSRGHSSMGAAPAANTARTGGGTAAPHGGGGGGAHSGGGRHR